MLRPIHAATHGHIMVYRLRSPGFARQLDADLHTLVHRGIDRRVSFGDRLVALDRIAGTTLIACTMVAAVWLAERCGRSRSAADSERDGRQREHRHRNANRPRSS